MSYQPDQTILNNYADILVNFALNHGNGIKKGDVVFIQVPECAKPILLPLHNAVLKAGGHPLIQYLPDGITRNFFTLASPDQINFFPESFYRGRVDQIDHSITIIADTDLHELEGIDPKLIMGRSIAHKPYHDWRDAKESEGKFTWTLAMYSTPAMAKEAHLSLKSCWQQIISACFLDTPSPLSSWKNAQVQINQTKNFLNSLPIVDLHLVSTKTDLHLGLDKNRRWLGGDGANIPSFEVFISPDWRKTSGYIFFDQPLYYQGNLIKNISLTFKNGQVTKYSAEVGESVLAKMIAVKNADKVGEFSLTDRRLSHIDKYMAETLFDENFGGKYGNTHLALGASFKESSDDINDSAIHCDIISTANRTVTATLEDGTKKIIYQNGQFSL